MFRIPYPVQIKILIFNQLKIFNSLLSFLLLHFLGNPLLLVLLSWFLKNGYKTPYLLSLWFLQILFGEERVFILYIFLYLHLGPLFSLSVFFSSIKSNPQQYRVYYNISNYFTRKFIFKNFWIPVFYLTICTNFFTFIYLFFLGFTETRQGGVERGDREKKRERRQGGRRHTSKRKNKKGNRGMHTG